jgi:putative phosphoribosyl transferase
MLAERLAQYRGTHPLILAVPRGAVPMGRILAEALDGDLDVVLVRKRFFRGPLYKYYSVGYG